MNPLIGFALHHAEQPALDDPLYANNVRARDAFRSLGLELTYEEGPGAHEWGYWDQQIQRVLAWLPLARPT